MRFSPWDDPVNWEKLANCATTEPEVMFPRDGESANSARAICAECTVVAQCLKAALEEGQQWGVRGGMTAYERRKLKQRRANYAPPEESTYS